MVKPSFDFSHLSPAERLALAEQLWASVLETPEAVRLSPDQEAELDRRLAAFRANPTAGRPWREVMDRLDQQRGA